MSWDHNFTVRVLRSDDSPAVEVEVSAHDTSIFGGIEKGYTDSDGEVSLNLPTVVTGDPIEIEIYVEGEKFGPYTVSDGENFTVV